MLTLKQLVRQRTDPALDLLRALVRQPSVAATGEGLVECASLVHQTFVRAGATAHPQERWRRPGRHRGISRRSRSHAAVLRSLRRPASRPARRVDVAPV